MGCQASTKNIITQEDEDRMFSLFEQCSFESELQLNDIHTTITAKTMVSSKKLNFPDQMEECDQSSGWNKQLQFSNASQYTYRSNSQGKSCLKRNCQSQLLSHSDQTQKTVRFSSNYKIVIGNQVKLVKKKKKQKKVGKKINLDEIF